MARKAYKSFVFSETLGDMTDALDESDRLRFFGYIKDYGLYNKEPELTGVERAVWVSMKTLIDNLSDRRGAPSGNANAARAPEPEPPAPQTGDGGGKTAGIQKVQKVQIVQIVMIKYN